MALTKQASVVKGQTEERDLSTDGFLHSASLFELLTSQQVKKHILQKTFHLEENETTVGQRSFLGGCGQLRWEERRPRCF